MEGLRAGLRARGIRKAYAGVPVLSNVDFDLAPGEIHALVGENGAGKSTFLKIIGGAVSPDEGQLMLEDAIVTYHHPDVARRLGVSVVYQEFTLVPDLSVVDNIFLGRERSSASGSRTARRRRASAVLEMLGASVPPDALVRGLSVAHQQLVEIARALVTEAKVLILDEPSASLSLHDVARLFAVLRDLVRRGLGIIYVSHRLDEVFEIADRITVLRDGRWISTTQRVDTSRAQIIRDMVGRDVSEEYPIRDARPGASVLEVRHLSAPPRVHDVSLTVRQGEIVGVAGLVGAGRSSAGLAIVGRLPANGDVRVSGRPMRFRSPHEAIDHGVAYVTDDRKAAGIFPMMGVDDNITLTHMSLFTRAGLLLEGKRRRVAAEFARQVDVRAARLTQPIVTLSGGNQQKALLARYLVRRPDVLILDEPTRGVDVGARRQIYEVMNRLTAEGVGILMMSSDLPEVIGMSDRIVVMRDGRVVTELSRAEATPDAVMTAATGEMAA